MMGFDVFMVVWLLNSVDFGNLSVKYGCNEWMVEGLNVVCMDENSEYYGCSISNKVCSCRYLDRYENGVKVTLIIPQPLKR